MLLLERGMKKDDKTASTVANVIDHKGLHTILQHCLRCFFATMNFSCIISLKDCRSNDGESRVYIFFLGIVLGF